MGLRERIDDGLAGKFQGLANGFDRLNKYIFGIQKGTYYLIGGQSGVFKTTLTDFMLVNAIEDAKKKGIKLNVFYYSYEIDKLTKQCNWLSIEAYKKFGIIIPPEKVKGLGDFRLDAQEQEIINKCIPVVEDLFSYINFEFTPTNPTGIFHQCIDHFKDRGEFKYEYYLDENQNKKPKVVGFIPNDPDEVTLGVLDHLYFLKKERDFSTKENIDKHSEFCIQLRNLYGMSWINVQQFNSSISSIERVKFKGVDLSPQQSDFKDTTNPYSDADVVIGLMNPYKLDMVSSMGYDVNKLNGNLLMLKIIKNRFSSSDIAIGLFANPRAGEFKELPPPNKINYNDYK